VELVYVHLTSCLQ